MFTVHRIECTVKSYKLYIIKKLPSSVMTGRKGKVMLKGPNGPTPREVTLGLEGEEHIEILSGLKEGDEVLVNPAASSAAPRV